MSHLFVRVALILSAVLIATLIGLFLPSLTLAAPPMIQPAQQDAPTTNDLLLIVLNLIAILLNGVVSGGWLALILDDIGVWKNWLPMSNAGKALKKWGVVALTAALAGALLYAQTYFIPREFVKLPIEAQFVIAAMVSYVASQFTHQRDVTFQYRQRAENQIFNQRIDTGPGYRIVGRLGDTDFVVSDAPTPH